MTTKSLYSVENDNEKMFSRVFSTLLNYWVYETLALSHLHVLVLWVDVFFFFFFFFFYQCLSNMHARHVHMGNVI